MLRRSTFTLLFAAVLAGGVACDLPTDPPRWDQTWIVPVDDFEVGVADFLPASIGLNADTTAFLADFPSSRVEFTLEDLCSACVALNGQTVPKPAFTDTFRASVQLPAAVAAAEVDVGYVPMALYHTFDFDPLRPSADPNADRGQLTLQVLNTAGRVLGQTVIEGASVAFPADETLPAGLVLDSATATQDLHVQVILDSPAGDSTTIDTSDRFEATTERAQVAFSSVELDVGTLQVDEVRSRFDFSGMEQDLPMMDRIKSGSIRLEVDNPFAVTGAFDFNLTTPSRTFTRSFTIESGTFERGLEFTGDELRNIVNSEQVDVRASGSLTPNAATVTVRPEQRVSFRPSIELQMTVGGEGQS